MELRTGVERLEVDLQGIGTIFPDPVLEDDEEESSLSEGLRASRCFKQVMGPFFTHAVEELRGIDKLYQEFTDRFTEVSENLRQMCGWLILFSIEHQQFFYCS